MQIDYHAFLNLVFIGFFAIFPVVNPIGGGFLMSPFFENLNRKERRIAVRKVAFNAFLVCVVSLFAGQWILNLFGISIPIVQLAGGMMICKMGWEFLTADDKPKKTENELDKEVPGKTKTSALHDISGKLFYPITFPATTGAGTISVLFTLSAHGASFGSTAYYINTGAILVSIIAICLMIYFLYFNTRAIIKFLGAGGENIVNRISAFLIFCVGLQIGVTGLKSLFDL